MFIARVFAYSLINDITYVLDSHFYFFMKYFVSVHQSLDFFFLIYNITYYALVLLSFYWEYLINQP
jgi:hypothetical protein